MGSGVSLGHWPICRVDVRELVARRLELRSKAWDLFVSGERRIGGLSCGGTEGCGGASASKLREDKEGAAVQWGSVGGAR